MEQIAKFAQPLEGAMGSSLVDGQALAHEAWGERADTRHSGLIAFAYLYRRFGPPALGCDNHKEIASYVLTTREPDVFLDLCPSASPLSLKTGYLVTSALMEEYYRVRPQRWLSPRDWRHGPPVQRRVNEALLEAMRELLLPVMVRDVAIDLFGTTTPAPDTTDAR